ncbi:MAG: eCIS core domain-containing protein [Tannerella sp.]|uniref:eCIS core domain-containing protein n=1 Tax=Tannerella sp. TaxID=2382127 RepID=UPI003FA201A7
MPTALRSQMESGFEADFSGVRLHTGSAAEAMSNNLRAKAFTYGNDIYFNRGQYSPDTTAGQHLIAHELTHVVQQSGKVGREGKPSSCYPPLFDLLKHLLKNLLKSLIYGINSRQNQVDILQSLISEHALRRGASDKELVANEKIAHSYRVSKEGGVMYTPFPGLVNAKKSEDGSGEYELIDPAIIGGPKCNFFVGDVLFAAYRDYIKKMSNTNGCKISEEEIESQTASFFKNVKNDLGLLQNKKYPKYEGAKKMGERIKKDQNQIKEIKDVKEGDIIWWESGEHIEIVVGKYDEKTETLECMGAHSNGSYAIKRTIKKKESFMSEEEPKGKVSFYRMKILPEINNCSTQEE